MAERIYHSGPLSEHKDFVERLAREYLGCDLEVEQHWGDWHIRGPISRTLIEDLGNEPGLYFELEWVASKMEQGWKLDEEVAPDRKVAIGLLEYVYISEENGRIYFTTPADPIMAQIHSLGDHLKRESLISS